MGGIFKATTAALCLALGGAPAFALAVAAPLVPAVGALSPAPRKVVARRIATLKSPAERRMAMGWSDAKKAAELICRPAALPALKRQVKDADKVFLGTDDPATLRLAGDRRLEGQGQVRAGTGWRDLTFVCDLDPATGKVAGFQATLKP